MSVNVKPGRQLHSNLKCHFGNVLTCALGGPKNWNCIWKNELWMSVKGKMLFNKWLPKFCLLHFRAVDVSAVFTAGSLLPSRNFYNEILSAIPLYLHHKLWIPLLTFSRNVIENTSDFYRDCWIIISYFCKTLRSSAKPLHYCWVLKGIGKESRKLFVI